MTDQESPLVALTEQVVDWRSEELQVELSERTVRNVLLSGGASKNGHRYSETALRDAAALYNHKPIFLDHAENLSRPYDRSMRDLAGTISEARYVDGRIQGDVQVLDTEAGRTLLVLMQSETPAIGMSHVILARKSQDGALVEKIHDVISVDAVVFPATTSGFREHIEATELEDVVAQLHEARQELAQAIDERDELKRRCDQYAGETAARQVEAQLAAADLPAFAITDGLRARLRTAPDAPTRSRLIAEHRDLVLRCRQRSPCSRSRDNPRADRHDPLTRQFVDAVKSRR